MTPKEMLGDWIRKDAEYFAEELVREKELVAEIKNKEVREIGDTAVEFYHTGKANALESVLRIGYQHYLELLVKIAEWEDKDA